METEKIKLPKDKAIYLATLYGKALDANVAHPILGDRYAAQAMARIDYDFKALKVPSGGEITLPMRALHFDQWTRAFLAMPELVERLSTNPVRGGMYRALNRLGFYRDLVRHLRYEF